MVISRLQSTRSGLQSGANSSARVCMPPGAGGGGGSGDFVIGDADGAFAGRKPIGCDDEDAEDPVPAGPALCRARGSRLPRLCALPLPRPAHSASAASSRTCLYPWAKYVGSPSCRGSPNACGTGPTTSAWPNQDKVMWNVCSMQPRKRCVMQT